MIKKFLLLVVFVQFIMIYYNYSEKKKELPEELKKQLKVVEDANKATVLIKLAKAYEYDKDKLKSYNYADQALKLAKRFKQRVEETDALGYISISFRRRKDYKKAFEYGFLRLKKTREYELGVKESYALSELSVIYYLKRDYKKGLEYGNKAVALAEKLKNNEAILYALDSLSLSYENDYLAVLKDYKKRKVIAEKMGDKEEIALSTHVVATMYFYVNNLKKSKNLYEEAISQYKEVKNYARVIQLMSYVSSIYKHQEKYDKSLNYLFNAEKYYNGLIKTDKEIDISYGRILADIAETNLKKKEYKKALHYCNLLQKHGEKIDESWLLGIAYRDFVNIYIEMKDYKTARKYLDRCYENEYGKDSESYLAKSRSHYNLKLAKIYMRTGQYEKAVSICEKDIEIYKKHSFTDHEKAELYKQLGEVYKCKKNYSEAISNIMKSIDYIEKYNKGMLIPKNKFLKANYKTLSEIYKETGNRELERKFLKLYDETVENLNKVESGL